MSDNNGMILHVTAAGRAQRTTCRIDGLPLPKFSGWTVDTATTQDIDSPTLQPLYTSSTDRETLVERIDAVAIGVRIIIPPTFAGWVRGIALLTSDGTVYAYARFAPENGGMYKPVGTAIRMLLILAEDGRETVEFTYAVVDTHVMKQQLLTEIRAELNIPAIAAMLEQAMSLCTIDGNELGWTLDGGNPDPECQLIPIDKSLNAVGGGTI